MDKRNRIEQYTKAYNEDYDFESILVKYRKQEISEFIKKRKPAKILEIGCGKDPLFKEFLEYESWEEWIVVEPSSYFAKEAETYCDKRCRVICDFFENVSTELAKDMEFDFIVCSALLHELENPKEFLKAVFSLCGDDTDVHINVPNALSFHRQLAVEMGLIESVFEKSDRNVQLKQYHIFDMSRLTNILEESGFELIEKGGYFIKPFTHEQMETIVAEFASDELLTGLHLLGKKYPELASEIYCNIRKSRQ